MSMSRRRWAILATSLVALNLFFWLAPPGLALRQQVIDQLFGPRMIRADVLVLGAGNTAQDYRIDRGIVSSVTSTAITLNEADGTQQTIPIDSGTRLLGLGARFGIQRLAKVGNIRVVVIHLANAPADSIQVEGRGSP